MRQDIIWAILVGMMILMSVIAGYAYYLNSMYEPTAPQADCRSIKRSLAISTFVHDTGSGKIRPLVIKYTVNLEVITVIIDTVTGETASIYPDQGAGVHTNFKIVDINHNK